MGLRIGEARRPPWPTTQSEFFNSNVCFHNIHASPRLEKAILSSNKLHLIDMVKEDDKPLSVGYVSLASNMLNDWHSLENLSRWCPALHTLSLRDTPIMSPSRDICIKASLTLFSTGTPYARSFVISYFPALQTLEGTRVGPVPFAGIRGGLIQPLDLHTRKN
jgi:hypothetical protein